MKINKELMKGSTSILILSLLDKEEMYGYQITCFFITLVVIGESEKMEMEMSLPLFSDSFRQLYHETKSGNGQKWLMINVTDNETLDDVKQCIAIRKKIQ